MNFIKIIQKFKNYELNEKWSYRDIVKADILQDLYKGILDDEPIIAFDCDSKIEWLPDLAPNFLKNLKQTILYHEDEYDSVSAFDIILDIDKMSHYLDFEDMEGTPMEKYISCLYLMYYETISELVNDFYNHRREKAALKIEKYFLDAYYNPRTKLGKKRFNKEFDKLIN